MLAQRDRGSQGQLDRILLRSIRSESVDIKLFPALARRNRSISGRPPELTVVGRGRPGVDQGVSLIAWSETKACAMSWLIAAASYRLDG